MMGGTYLAVTTCGTSVVVSGPASSLSESLSSLSLSSESLSAAPGVAVPSSLLWLSSSSSDSWLVLLSLSVLAFSSFSSSSSGLLELSLVMSPVLASLVLVLSSSGIAAWRWLGSWSRVPEETSRAWFSSWVLVPSSRKSEWR